MYMSEPKFPLMQKDSGAEKNVRGDIERGKKFSPETLVKTVDNVRNDIVEASEINDFSSFGLDGFSYNLWNTAQKLIKAFKMAYGALPQQQLQVFVIALISLFQLGCQYSPNFREDYNGPRVSLDDAEIAERWRLAEQLFHHRVHNIEPCQDSLMRENLEELIEETDEEYLRSYIQTCEYLRENLCIENFTRYSPAFLREVERNIRDPEYKSELPVVVAIIAHEDHEAQFVGTQALTVESHNLERLIDRYKVILMESHDIAGVERVTRYLQRNGILHDRNLAGIISGAHSNFSHMGNGISTENMDAFSQLFNNYFSLDKKGLIVLAGCNTAADSENTMNLTESASLYFSNAQVIGCSSLMYGIDFSFDEEGEQFVSADQVEMKGWLDFLSFGITNSNATPDREEVIRQRIDEITKKTPEVPQPFVLQCLNEGVTRESDIAYLYEKDISPQQVHEYRSLYNSSNMKEIADLIDLDIPVESVLELAELDTEERVPHESPIESGILDLLLAGKNGISLSEATNFNRVARIDFDTLSFLTTNGISANQFQEQINEYFKNGNIDIDQAIFAFRQGVTAEEIQELSEHCSEDRNLIQKSIFLTTARELGISKENLYNYLAVRPEMTSGELMRIFKEDISPEEYQQRMSG